MSNTQKPVALRLVDKYEAHGFLGNQQAPAPAGEYPPLPEWSKMDNLGGLVPSEIQQELRAYVDADRAMWAQQPAPSAAADLIAALEEARSAINSMKVEAETAGQGDEQMMLEACETISNEGLQADIAIRVALASHRQAPAQAAPVQDYPPLPDFDTVEQHIYGACRRYITRDMLEPSPLVELIEVQELSDTERGAGGFGSTGA